MFQFCVSVHEDRHGNHVIHREGCASWPSHHAIRLLGLHSYCDEALRSARTFFGNVDGCHSCIPQCHAQFQIRGLTGGIE